jgi:hypothetical protein
MARSKVTNADIHARLARGECANYRQNGCRGQSPCTIVVGEPCDYFNRYVKPLLDYTEFSAKYQREAKVTIAINPNAKVVRARRSSNDPRLALDASPASADTTPPAPGTAKATRPAPASKAVPSAKAAKTASLPDIVSPSKPTKAAVAATLPDTAPPAKPVKAAKVATAAHAPVAPKPEPTAPPAVMPRPAASIPALDLLAPAAAPATTPAARTPKVNTPPAKSASIPPPAPQLVLELVPASAPPKKMARKR